MMNRTKIVVAAIFAMLVVSVFYPTLYARQADKGSRSVWDGVYTKEQVKRGEVLYAQHCSSCHGPDLSGNDEAAPLVGAAFLANWEGLTVGDLAERVRVTMPPNNVGKISRQQITDILAYTLSFNSFPDGKTELDSKPESQKLIRIAGTKPKANSN